MDRTAIPETVSSRARTESSSIAMAPSTSATARTTGYASSASRPRSAHRRHFGRAEERLVVVSENIAVKLAVDEVGIFVRPAVGRLLIGRLSRFVCDEESLPRHGDN